MNASLLLKHLKFLGRIIDKLFNYYDCLEV